MTKKDRRDKLHSALNVPSSRNFLLTNDILAAITVVSIVSIVLETVDSLSEYNILFNVIEYGAVFVFSVEYMVRISIATNKRKYLFSFFGIIDLLSILPTYFGVANLTFLKSVRVLRIMRFLRVLRLTKVARVRGKEADLEDYSDLYTLNFAIYFIGLSFAIVFLGVLIYIVEGESFSNALLGMEWATKTLLGLGVPEPSTILGRLLLLVTRFVGLALFGLLIHIIGSFLRKAFFGNKNI